MKKALIAGALVLAPVLGHAQLLGSAEIFYSDSEFDTNVSGAPTLDADGFGLRGLVKLPGSGIYFRGAYLDETVDTPLGDADYEETRLAAGIGFSVTPVIDLGVEAEYGDFELDGDGSDGFGLFGSAETNLPIINAYGRIGLLRLEDDSGDDVDGTELTLGGRFGLLPLLSLFAEYRLLTLEDDANNELDIDGFRLGARFSF